MNGALKEDFSHRGRKVHEDRSHAKPVFNVPPQCQDFPLRSLCPLWLIYWLDVLQIKLAMRPVGVARR